MSLGQEALSGEAGGQGRQRMRRETGAAGHEAQQVAEHQVLAQLLPVQCFEMVSV